MNRRLDGEEIGGRRVSGTRMSRRSRRGDESGQALVEFALILPLVVLLIGVAFNGWNAMQLDIGLTSAARAGALQAANDLANNTFSDPSCTTVACDATNAINQEESTTIYQYTNPSAANYVSVTTPPQITIPDTPPGAPTVTMNIVDVSISPAAVDLIPYVGDISVNVHASARYS
jgi:Flp pilus assembly protein TadG